jgi:nucleotide-binding universal stress UspA family protein
MYRHILVPVDGSPTSRRGVQEAIRLASLTGGEIRLVHVLDPWLHANGFETSTTYCSEVLPRMRREGARILDEARAPVVAAGRAVTTALVESLGDRVTDMVLDQSRQWNADVIVIGSHGRRGWDRALMGSDAEQVARRASVPVLVVRAEAARPEPGT